ncbi:G-protein coupled estrogen receptor 1 [Erinaceus europaeus]|uniref:G-protein coupled estrogen receptor 1 n=1 Tax=Erinaceus europaeus TaxID=9365 RepID=A0A1S2ZVB5_ERIEU|nr:G-protein coupled estrogen receptor 1 [Erinaceus europaeus]XP_060029176.1 G-protein coupled estrogen receptor 1 [Erinaceus europaeus]
MAAVNGSNLTGGPWGGPQYALGLALSCIYTAVLFPIGLLGNVMILGVNLRARRMTVPDLYFSNLAAADLVLVADSLIEVFNLHGQYYDKAALCTSMALFLQATMYSSVFFLAWMSVDRYLALARAVHCGPLRTKRRARLSCGLIWAAAALATLAPFSAVQLHPGAACACFADVRAVQWLELWLGFLLPLAVIALCYSLVARVLLRAARRRAPRPRRQRALRMMAAMVLVFFLCWLPENVFISLQLLWPPGPGPCPPSLRQSYPLAGHLVNLAAFSNSCLNPLVYSFLGETFRVKLRLCLQQRTGTAPLGRLCNTARKAPARPSGSFSSTV